MRMVALLASLLVIYGVAVALLAAITDIGAIALVALVLALAAAQILAGHRIALRAVRARPATAGEADFAQASLVRLAQLADVPVPRLAIAPTPAPLAFVVGRSPRNATVCLSAGIIDLLPDDELGAVLAHEISHVEHWDTVAITVATSMSTFAGLALRAYWWDGILNFGRPPGWARRTAVGRRQGRWMLVAFPITVVCMFAMLILRFLLVIPAALLACFAAIAIPAARALSRARERAADHDGALLAGSPVTLAAALLRIAGAMPMTPLTDLRRASLLSALLILPPAVPGESFARRLVATHPPVEARVEWLLDLQATLDGVSAADVARRERGRLLAASGDHIAPI